jgi:hypothetical protein
VGGADMNTVTLTRDGSILRSGKTVETDSLMFLSYKVNLSRDYILRSYFQMLEKYPFLAKLNEFFPSYLEQYLASPKSNCFSEGIDHLELSKTVEMIGFPDAPRLEIYNSFHGVHGDESCEIRSLQIESLLDMEVKLGRLKHIVFGDKVDIFEFDTVFTFFEFIEAIAWELSFHVAPPECALRR